MTHKEQTQEVLGGILTSLLTGCRLILQLCVHLLTLCVLGGQALIKWYYKHRQEQTYANSNHALWRTVLEEKRPPRPVAGEQTILRDARPWRAHPESSAPGLAARTSTKPIRDVTEWFR